MLTFKELREANASRLQKWHNGAKREWIGSDWTNAMAGEVGEACNAMKKLMRMYDGLNNVTGRDTTIEDAKQHVMTELADTVIYADLVAEYLGMSLEEVIIYVFNQKSVEYNFPERIGVK